MGRSPHMTISRAIQTVSMWKGNAPAITVTGPGVELRHVSFRELEEHSNRMARAYMQFGVERNCVVTITLPTGSEPVIASFATWKLGATLSNVSNSLTFPERDAIVRLADPKIVVGVPSLLDPSMPLHEGYRCLPEGFVPDPNLSIGPLPDTYSNSWLVATSGGSTGRPKLILLNEPSIVTMKDTGGGRLAMENFFGVDGGAVVNGVDLIPCPMSHNAPYYSVIQGLLAACHQVLLTKFDAEWMLQLIEEYRCTYVYVVPIVMKRVWDLPEQIRLSYDVSSLQGAFHMAAPCPPWLKEAWCSWLGPKKIFELYGATEAQAYTLIRGDEWLRRPKMPGLNLVGRAAVGELQIRDPDTKELVPAGTMGEVWMRHHERRITYHYRGAESKPDEHGWETMGDMGLLDAEGYLHLGDRKADMVLIGGFNVYPAEVEAVLEHHPAVKSAVAVGVPDRDMGSVLHAVVYTGTDCVSCEELEAFCKERLSKPKVPKAFKFVDEHVRGADGKARRALIAKDIASAKRGANEPAVQNKLEFHGRVAIVTGAGNGLGREYALLLAARGASVIVNDLGVGLKGEGDGAMSSAADNTVNAIREAGGTAVANYDSVVDGDKIVRTALDTYGRVDIIINNAGILRDVSFRKMTYDDWDKVYQVHLRGAFAVTHAAWTHMEKNNYGRIMNVTSSTGLYGSFGQSNYAAMKAAMLGFTFTLALEGAKRNIRANAIAPLGASRMMESVRTNEELKALPLNTMANLAGYLCHESCKSNGGIFELGGHWISRLSWRRSRGVRFPADFTMEDVAARFDDIGDFSDGAEYPDDADSGEAHSMMPPAARL